MPASCAPGPPPVAGCRRPAKSVDGGRAAGEALRCELRRAAKAAMQRSGDRDGLADLLQNPARRLDRLLRRFPERARRLRLQLHLRRAGLLDRRADRPDAGVPAAAADRDLRRHRLVAASLDRPGRADRVLAPSGHQSRLLGGHDRDAGARGVRDAGVHGGGRAFRHRRGAPAVALHRDSGRCST